MNDIIIYLPVKILPLMVSFRERLLKKKVTSKVSEQGLRVKILSYWEGGNWRKILARGSAKSL